MQQAEDVDVDGLPKSASRSKYDLDGGGGQVSLLIRVSHKVSQSSSAPLQALPSIPVRRAPFPAETVKLRSSPTCNTPSLCQCYIMSRASAGIQASSNTE